MRRDSEATTPVGFGDGRLTARGTPTRPGPDLVGRVPVPAPSLGRAAGKGRASPACYLREEHALPLLRGSPRPSTRSRRDRSANGCRTFRRGEIRSTRQRGCVPPKIPTGVSSLSADLSRITSRSARSPSHESCLDQKLRDRSSEAHIGGTDIDSPCCVTLISVNC